METVDRAARICTISRDFGRIGHREVRALQLDRACSMKYLTMNRFVCRPLRYLFV
jgi:hypothetical protein